MFAVASILMILGMCIGASLLTLRKLNEAERQIDDARTYIQELRGKAATYDKQIRKMQLDVEEANATSLSLMNENKLLTQRVLKLVDKLL